MSFIDGLTNKIFFFLQLSLGSTKLFTEIIFGITSNLHFISSLYSFLVAELSVMAKSAFLIIKFLLPLKDGFTKYKQIFDIYSNVKRIILYISKFNFTIRTQIYNFYLRILLLNGD